MTWRGILSRTILVSGGLALLYLLGGVVFASSVVGGGIAIWCVDNWDE